MKTIFVLITSFMNKTRAKILFSLNFNSCWLNGCHFLTDTHPHHITDWSRPQKKIIGSLQQWRKAVTKYFHNDFPATVNTQLILGELIDMYFIIFLQSQAKGKFKKNRRVSEKKYRQSRVEITFLNFERSIERRELYNWQLLVN